MNVMPEKINNIQSIPVSGPWLDGLTNGLKSKNIERMHQALRNFDSVAERFLNRGLPVPNPRSWSHFASLPETHQLDAIRGVEGQTSFIEMAMAEGLDAFDELGMLNYAKKTFSLLGDSSLSDQIRQDDIVEIVDENFIQVYRSYSCFALCNYSLLELTSYPWWELYDRPKMVTEDLISRSSLFFEGNATFMWLEGNFPSYILRELMTEEQEAYRVQERFGAKLKSAINGQTYILSVKNIAPLDCEKDSLSFI